MSTDPYAAPSANLDTESAVIPTSLWSAKGRLGVLSYFAQSILFTIVAMIILFAVLAIIGAVMGGGIENLMQGGDGGPATIAMAVVGIPIFLAMVYAGWCFIIKRLHDRGHSGWMSLIMLIPIVSLLLYLYLLVPGNKTSNLYGAPRPTKGWEKVVGIIGILLMLGSIVAVIGGIVTGAAGM